MATIAEVAPVRPGLAPGLAALIPGPPSAGVDLIDEPAVLDAPDLALVARVGIDSFSSGRGRRGSRSGETPAAGEVAG